MHPVYSPSRPKRQSKSIVPMPSHDGPTAAELRARRVQNRFSYSPEVAAQIAALAFAVPEKEARA